MALRLKRYKRQEDREGKVLVVFIHGLGAPDNTWISEKNSWTNLLLTDKRFLETDVAIIKYGSAHVALGSLYKLYERFSDKFRFFRTSKISFGRGPYTSINKLAQELKRELNMNDILGYEQILLVCHSMGGLVGIRYILEEIEREIPTKVSGFVSLATPFNGSNKAIYHKLVSGIHNHTQIPQLEPNSLFNDDTIRLWQKHWSKMSLSCVFCYGTEDNWVPEESSIPHFIVDKWSGGVALPGDHSSILNVESHTSISYAVISEKLLSIIESNKPAIKAHMEDNNLPVQSNITIQNENNEHNIASPLTSTVYINGGNRILCLFDLAYFGVSLNSRLGWLFGHSLEFDQSIKEFKRLMNDLNFIIKAIYKDETDVLMMLESLSNYTLSYILGEQEQPRGWNPVYELAESIQNRVEALEYTLDGKELGIFKLGHILGRWDNNEPLTENKLTESSEKLILQFIENVSSKKKVPDDILQIFKEYRNTDSISNIRTPHRVYNKVRTMLTLDSISNNSN